MRKSKISKNVIAAVKGLSLMLKQKMESFEERAEDMPINEEELSNRAFDLGFRSVSFSPILFWNKMELSTDIIYNGERLTVRFIALFPRSAANPDIPVYHSFLISIRRDDNTLCDYIVPITVVSFRQLEECMLAVISP